MVPHAVNRRCARHILANFRLKFLGRQLRKMFWMAARSYNSYGYDKAMKKVKEINSAAYEWLIQSDPHMWSRSKYPTDLKNDHVTNNIAESFNAWIGEFRDKNVLLLLEGIRKKVMTRMHTRRQKRLNWTNEIMPKILKKINDQCAWAKHCELSIANSAEYQVDDKSMSYIVNLEQKTCECRIWDVSGIPCRHACCAILHNRNKVEKFTDKSYRKEKYMLSYAELIHPIPDHRLWPPLEDVVPQTLMPPELRRLPGRPRKNRRREAWESANTGGEDGPANPTQYRVSRGRCKICGEIGHNKRTCQRAQGGTQSSQGKKRKHGGDNAQVH